jgi:hypothetical protein
MTRPVWAKAGNAIKESTKAKNKELRAMSRFTERPLERMGGHAGIS